MAGIEGNIIFFRGCWSIVAPCNSSSLVRDPSRGLLAPRIDDITELEAESPGGGGATCCGTFMWDERILAPTSSVGVNNSPGRRKSELAGVGDILIPCQYSIGTSESRRDICY